MNTIFALIIAAAFAQMLFVLLSTPDDKGKTIRDKREAIRDAFGLEDVMYKQLMNSLDTVHDLAVKVEQERKSRCQWCGSRLHDSLDNCPKCGGPTEG